MIDGLRPWEEQTMSRLRAIAAFATLSMILMPGNAWSQQKPLKDQLIGTWHFVSWVGKTKSSVSTNPVGGADPKGVMSFDAAGGVYFILIADVPKLASSNRLKTTPEENQAIAHGTFAYFGSYKVNEADRSFTIRVERSSYANQVGTDNKRVITALTEHELVYTTPATTSGGTNDWAWRRSK
jgi:Lipocalin-like domain